MLRGLGASVGMGMALRARLLSGALKRFAVPSMGDSISEGTVIALGKALGEPVAAEEVVLSVETDKVTIDVRALEAGTLSRLFAKVGDTVVVGADLYELSLGAGAASSAPPPAPAAASPAAAAAVAPTAAPPPPPPAAGVRYHPSGKPVGIRFVGRRNGPPVAAPPAPTHAAPSAPARAAQAAAKPPTLFAPAGAAAPLWSAADETTRARYPRLPVSEAEALAVNSGGAE